MRLWPRTRLGALVVVVVVVIGVVVAWRLLANPGDTASLPPTSLAVREAGQVDAGTTTVTGAVGSLLTLTTPPANGGWRVAEGPDAQVATVMFGPAGRADGSAQVLVQSRAVGTTTVRLVAGDGTAHAVTITVVA